MSLNKYKYILLLLCGLLHATASAAQTTYFIVGELNAPAHHNDSYVLPLSEPADIAHARNLIANGPRNGGAIVAASMRAGSDGINRNYGNPAHGTLNPAAPEWSWHIDTDRPIFFADFTIEILDGWPTFIESDVQGWINNTNGAGDPPGVGNVGFWSYTVIAELIPGDLDADGDIDGVDLGSFFSSFTGPGNGPAANPRADLDGDGDIDGVDLGKAFGTFTGPAAPSNVPEPGALYVLICAAAVALRRRRARTARSQNRVVPYTC